MCIVPNILYPLIAVFCAEIATILSKKNQGKNMIFILHYLMGHPATYVR